MAVEWLIALLCAAGCAVIPWTARALPVFVAALALGAGILIAVAGGVLSIAPFPWTDVVVWLVATSGGLLLDRLMPPRFRPYLALFLVLSALDIIQITLTSGAPSTTPAPAPPASFYGNFRIAASWLPRGHFTIGIFDLALLVTLAEFWRRRAASWWYALGAGWAGLSAAYAFVALTGIASLPLIPFITAGWLLVEAWRLAVRARSLTRGRPAS